MSQSHSSYLEKFCIPAKLAKNLQLVSLAIPNHILVGHVQEVQDVQSLLECKLACLRAENNHGFVCKSAMWYPNDLDQVKKFFF